MTFSWITNLFRRSPAGSRQASPVPPSALQSASAPRVASIYPPDDPGLVPRTVDDLIGSNESLVDRLRVHAATDAVTFQSRFLDPINRMASQVNLFSRAREACYERLWSSLFIVSRLPMVGYLPVRKLSKFDIGWSRVGDMSASLPDCCTLWAYHSRAW